MKRSIGILIAFATLSGIVGVAINYGRIPETVPMHWNVNGSIDGYGPRWILWILAMLPLAIAGIGAVMPLIDPRKENYLKHGNAFGVTIAAIALVMEIILWVALLTVIGYQLDVKSIVLATIGILFMVTGNYLPQVRHNYMFGIRTPWTIASEKVWRATHRVGGYVFIILGAVLLIASFLRGNIAACITFPSIVIGILFLFVYSYLQFRSEKKVTHKK